MRLQAVQTSRNLTGHAGQAAIGHCLNHFAQLPAAVDPALPVRSGIATSDVVRAYVRLPSGKFDTNDAVLSLAVLAYNSLRLIGQCTLLGDDAPRRHPAKRRRLKTVMQEIIDLAAMVGEHARRVVLGFSGHVTAFTAYRRLIDHWRIQLA